MTQTDDVQNTPEARVRELLERGIAQVKAGEHDLGMAAFEDAGRQATDAGLTALAAGAAIDRGWALWLAGDRERSVTAYGEGAVLAREARDDKRLAIALGNLGIAYTDAGRHADADALYTEYVEYLADDLDEQVDARLNWGVALEGLGRLDDAFAQLDEAQQLAMTGGLDAALVQVHLGQGGMRERAGDTDEAFELYWKAFDIASEAEDAELVGTVTMTLGRAYTRAADHSKAADCFGEAARAYRYLEDDASLGDALYQQGLALQRVGLLDQALDVWREAEPIFRETGDHRALGECLLAQALAVRDQLSNLGPDLQFIESASAFRAAGAVDRLPDIHLVHAQWCWDRSLDDAARTHVREALDALVASPNARVESRARALNAQLLAEAREIEQAETELGAAEAVARAADDAEGVTGVLVRRAYVMARGGATWEDVRAQLFAAGDRAREAGHESAGRYAAEAIATEIEERCGRAYTDLLGAEDVKNVLVPGVDEGV
ncbi:MAG: tetratricopeptide repeat protein [Coriobacteriia bacterium]